MTQSTFSVTQASHVLVIGMKRGQDIPEWEEICAVAMAVQNMYLVRVNHLLGVWRILARMIHRCQEFLRVFIAMNE
jgi:hypothetical protein